MNLYRVLKARHQKEVNEFPISFAFSEKQFEEGMRKLGLHPSETNKVYSIGAGGFIRKSDSKAFDEMFKRHNDEMKNAIAQDKTGAGFIKDMFVYEMGNHEFDYTGDLEPVLDALDLTFKDIEKSKKLQKGLKLAIKLFREEY
ncbi:MAG: hypothetical protein IJZ77_02995 [Bacilli bacterium]|nr:hypothetical protein [Bacilli bacterium]